MTPRRSVLKKLQDKLTCLALRASLVVQMVKKSACNARDLSSNPGFDPLEKGTATHSSNLAWRIPCTEEQRIGHN